jgi:hypothetical protein
MKTALSHSLIGFLLLAVALPAPAAPPSGFAVTEDADQINVTGPALDFAIRKKGYVSGVWRGSFRGFRDPGSGLDIADFILEPGSDEAYRDQLTLGMPYKFNTPEHGKRAKRLVEGPQICTRAKELTPRVIQGPDFLAVTMSWNYNLAAPTGSEWNQTLVFPTGNAIYLQRQDHQPQ